MRLSRGIEWLIEQQGIHRKAKTITVIPTSDAPLSPCLWGGRVIQVNGQAVVVISRQRKGDRK